MSAATARAVAVEIVEQARDEQCWCHTCRPYAFDEMVDRIAAALDAAVAEERARCASELQLRALSEEGGKLDPECDADTRHWLTGRARALREAAAALRAPAGDQGVRRGAVTPSVWSMQNTGQPGPALAAPGRRVG